MRSNNELNICRVCGLEFDDFFPWGEDGNIASFDICDCCGVEFGYEDIQLVSIRQYREKWLEKGASWHHPKYKPENWNLEEQLSHIPSKYL